MTIAEPLSIALLTTRIFLGCLFFFQGYDAVFKVGVPKVIRTYEFSFSQRGIPSFVTVFGSWFTSLAALVGGGLLILGLFKFYALYLLGLDLILSAIAFGITTPVWDTRHVFPRLILLLALLLLPAEWDLYSLDQLIRKP